MDKILGGVIEGKDVEDDAGVSCCHRYGGFHDLCGRCWVRFENSRDDQR